MRFIFNLFIREIRSSWRRLLFFFLCIAIGVGSIVGLRSLIQNLSQAVGGDARALLTADFEISTSNTFSPEEISRIEAVVNQANIVEARNETITTNAMTRPASAAQEGSTFIELKGIEPPFPLVGNFVMSDGKPFDFKLLENRGAVVAPILLEKLNLKVGDKIRIGEADFEIRATFDEEPGDSGGFRLGPRVFIERKAFDETGINRSGSRIRRRILYRTSDNPTPLVTQLRAALKGTILNVRSYRESQDRLNDQFERTENYLSLTGLLILVLGGVGVWNVARVFVEQKRKTVAVLKCLGADSGKVIFVYLAQILTLGFFGSLFGVLLAQIGLKLAGWYFGADLPENMSYALQPAATWQGILLGVMVSLLFSALPLLQIRNIKPNLLLRDEAGENLRKLDWSKWILGTLTLAGILGLSVWQAGSWRIGTAFLVGLGVTSAILYGSALALTFLLKKTKVFSSFAVSQAINSLYRPGNQTRIILLAVGLGAFVVLTVQSLQANLIREFDFTRNQTLPSLFIIDIQRSQIDGIKKLAEAATGEAVNPVPTVRARIAYVDGKPLDLEQRETREQQGRIGREFAVTYRTNLDTNETVTSGTWWDNTPSKDAEVSVEEDMAKDMNVKIGSTITFDILGRKINARVASIRKIDLRNTRTVFIFVFRPGVLENAPQTFALPLTKKLPAVERARFQRDVIDQNPNVQVFDVQDIVATVGKLVNNFVLAISFVGSFVMLTGILILIGSVALTKSQRVYENAILKTLGAKRASLATILFTEYGLLGLLAGLIGAFFAVLLSFVVTRFIFQFEWELDLPLAILGVIITTLLVTIIGALASFDVLFKKPLSILRSQ